MVLPDASKNGQERNEKDMAVLQGYESLETSQE